MKKPFVYLLLFFHSYVALSQTKQVDNFKAIKKTVDSLTLIIPLVEVDILGSSAKDTALAGSIRKALSDEIADLLSDRYKLNMQQADLLAKTDVAPFIDKMDQTESISNTELIPENLYPAVNDGNYFVAVFFIGSYDKSYPPNYRTNQLLLNNAIAIKKGPFCESKIALAFCNRNEKRVLFYHTISSKKLDPRLKDDVTGLARDLVKPIYYK